MVIYLIKKTYLDGKWCSEVIGAYAHEREARATVAVFNKDAQHIISQYDELLARRREYSAKGNFNKQVAALLKTAMDKTIAEGQLVDLVYSYYPIELEI